MCCITKDKICLFLFFFFFNWYMIRVQNDLLNRNLCQSKTINFSRWNLTPMAYPMSHKYVSAEANLESAWNHLHAHSSWHCLDMIAMGIFISSFATVRQCWTLNAYISFWLDVTAKGPKLNISIFSSVRSFRPFSQLFSFFLLLFLFSLSSSFVLTLCWHIYWVANNIYDLSSHSLSVILHIFDKICSNFVQQTFLKSVVFFFRFIVHYSRKDLKFFIHYHIDFGLCVH